jgi:hypothetical protein
VKVPPRSIQNCQPDDVSIILLPLFHTVPILFYTISYLWLLRLIYIRRQAVVEMVESLRFEIIVRLRHTLA